MIAVRKAVLRMFVGWREKKMGEEVVAMIIWGSK
jgi:hypothetical protein